MKNTIVLMGLLFLAITAKGQSWKTSFTTRGTGEHAQLAESPNGNVYLGFRDFQAGKANVKVLKNGTWNWLGDSAFSPEWIGGFKMDIAPDGNPVVAFQDINKSYQLTVMKYSGTKWDTLGRRGFSGFTSSGDFAITCSDRHIFVAYQQYNQIKVWYYNSTTNSWDFIGNNGIGSFGFPSGCDLKVIGSKLYLAYRNNPGGNEVRNVDTTALSSNSLWYTVKGSFGSGMSGQIKLNNILNMPMASNTASANGYMYNYIYGAGAWNNTGMPPYAASKFDICDGGADTFPFLAITDLTGKGRLYRGNTQMKWDSIGSSSLFTADVIKGKPEVLWTADKRLFVAYEDNATWKMIVKEYCAKVSNSTVDLVSNDSICEGEKATLKIAAVGATVQWYKDGTALVGSTGNTLQTETAGLYNASVKNTCGDSVVTAAVQVTVVPKPLPSITWSGNKLETGTYNAYQWFLNGNPISGANSQSYTPTQGGIYKVSALNPPFCIGISNEYTWWPAGVNSISNVELLIYPNPTAAAWNIESPIQQKYWIENAQGVTVKFGMLNNHTTIDGTQLPAGYYVIKTENGSTQMILKL